MRRDDELRVLRDHVRDHRHQPELALGAQRRLRLVQQVEPARNEPRLEEPQEALAVRVGVEVHAVPLAPSPPATGAPDPSPAPSPRRIDPRTRPPAPPGAAGTRSASADSRFAKPKKSSARRKNPRFVRRDHTSRSASASSPLRVERGVGVQVGAADRREPRRRRDRLQQRRLPRAVLPDEEGHRAGQRQRVQRPDHRDRERERAVVLAVAPAHLPQERRPARKHFGPLRGILSGCGSSGHP